MEEVAAVRRVAIDVTADVVPLELRKLILETVHATSMVPGVVTVRCPNRMEIRSTDALIERGAGVQLIYDGLRITRQLAQDDPWASQITSDRELANLSILAADVLVSRGFYLLARTAAAEAAVDVVRAFGHDQTEREDADSTAKEPLNLKLEIDILHLALIAGFSMDGSPPEDCHTIAEQLAPETPGFGSVEQFFGNDVDALATVRIDSGRPLNRND